MDKYKAIAAIGKRQHQLITTWQLRMLELSDKAIAERVARREWHRPAVAVISLSGAMSPLRRLAAAVLSLSSPEGADLRVEEAVEGGASRIEALVWAAMAASPTVCGRSALWLHGIGPAPSKPWLRLPRKGAGSSARSDTIVRYGPLTGAVHWLEGLPCVDVEQAFMDIPGGRDHSSPLWLHHNLASLVSRAHARRELTLDQLDGRIAGAPRFVGAPTLRRVLADLRGELSHSATEKKARRMIAEVLRRYELALHPQPYPVVHHREIVGEADLAVVRIALDLEIDGPHHRFPEQQAKDRIRDRRMRRASWEVERFPTELVDLSPARFIAEVEECIVARLKVVPP